ncbi:hypothetical protein Sru01_40970 [Sphaerisporangium rufum]|uniref:Uncharacterized protein n=1 Tax=Sphaerisporangium rufum TaxID=1381558 RepID=A0A919R889_9ACTN|nr:hypothetical protein [Sphaerisporangium rufum]GII79115.1 hypothetical protein Sru01_40970 [Sphaerisporangium rufum]
MPESSLVPDGWSAFRSDTGRWWATRDRPFSEAESKTDAHRTVDADDKAALTLEIVEQENRAAQAVS